MQIAIQDEAPSAAEDIPELAQLKRRQADLPQGKLRRVDSLNLAMCPPRVALIVETSTLFGRRLLSGIA